MSRFLSSKYAQLECYTPGEQPQDMRYVKLNTNELPYPPSPDVIAAVTAEQASLLRLYPDPACGCLTKKLAEYYGVFEKNIFLSNGSDDILNFAFMAFGDKGAAFADITYGFYTVFAELSGTEAKIIPLKEDLTIDAEDYLGLNRLIVIANPNAPTGREIPPEDIEKIASSNKDSVVVIDEAYVDFGGVSAVPLINEHDNIMVVMTYSKSRGMAGARVGFAIAGEDIISDLMRIKFSTNPYSINRLSMAAAQAALTAASKRYYEEKSLLIIRERERTAKTLEKLGFTVLPSKANFIFAKHPDLPGKEVYSGLKKRGVLVRHFEKERIKDYIRVTIGTKEEMDIFLENITSL